MNDGTRKAWSPLDGWARFALSVAMLSGSAWLLFGRIGAGLVLGAFGALLTMSLLASPESGEREKVEP